jgi:hypothetical protein
VCFVDFEKAFYSLNRETLWKLMRHYGIPFRSQYTNMKAKVVHGGELTKDFEVKTVCLLSSSLFLLAQIGS